MNGARGARLDVRRAASRPRTDAAGVRTWHSFSFGAHYDPHDVGFGLLLAHNDEHVAAGRGYERHRHRDVEIVTWVVEGLLLHRHGDEAERVLGPGSVQVLDSGAGVTHSERAGGRGPVRFVQAWLPSLRSDARPSYAARDLSGVLAGGGTVVVAAGGGLAPGAPGVALGHPGAALHVIRGAGEVTLPAAPYLHVYVTRGEAALHDVGRLGAGDAVRAVDAGEGRAVRTRASAEVLVWEMHPAG